MRLSLKADGFSEKRLWGSVTDILSSNELCSIATVFPDGYPYINTCFFAFDENLSLHILTPPTTQHAKNFQAKEEVAVAVFDSHQISGSELRGLQIFGNCSQVVAKSDLEQSFATYAERFASIVTAAPNVQTMLETFESRLFIIEPTRIKIFDEPTFGKETWITASLDRLPSLHG